MVADRPEVGAGMLRIRGDSVGLLLDGSVTQIVVMQGFRPFGDDREHLTV
jgi:hypothetical protein